MGVLDRIWEGQYARGPDGTQIPVDRPAALSDVEDPEAWWEIPSQGALARKVRRYYPLLRPVVDKEGGLVEVVPLCPDEDQEAARRGYRKAGKARRLGLMSFLSCTPPCNKPGAAQE